MTGSTETPVKVGRYELVLPLGQGPLGELWAASVSEGPEQGRVVSVRRVRFGGDKLELRAPSARAADVSRSLRHPKVAAVLDVDERDDELVIVSEHVDGESLAALLRQSIVTKSPISPGVALAIARDAIDALVATRDHFAKEPHAPLPHGGLVADGLVVAAFGDTMLTEPGVLAALGDAALRTTALRYCAPEQLETPRKRDERSDVYSVGVLLWEMLANRALFHSTASAEAAAEAELRRMVCEQEIGSLDSLPRQSAPLSPALVVLVARALLRDPAQRFQSLDALRAALDMLPRDLVSPPEQVVVTLERLARNSLETRRGALRAMEEEGRVSLSPESTRQTARPAQPDAPVPVVIPSLGAAPAIVTASFATSEAPTKPRRKLTPAALPVPVLKQDDGESAPAQAAGPAPSPEPPKAEELAPVRTSEATGVSVLEGDEARALPVRSNLRRFGPLALIAVGVVVVGVALLARSNPTSSDSQTAATGSTQAATLGSPAPDAPNPEPSASAPEEPAASAPSAASAAPSASVAPTRPRDTREREVRPKPPGGFRPKGI